jgi:glycine oxidase
MLGLVDTAHVLARRGVRAEVLDAASVRREEPYLNEAVAGGLLIDGQGFVAAGPLTNALAAAARQQGVGFLDGDRVRRIFGSGDSLCLETSRDTLTADRVVVAAGSWAGQIEIHGASTTIPVKPVRGQLARLNWAGPAPRRVIWGEPCYVVPWDDGTVLVGATVEDAGFDERTTVAGVRDLLASVCELLPHAANAGFGGARAGLRPASPDDLPIIGPSNVLPNVVYACGHYRNGVLLAPVTAQLVANLLLDGERDQLLELTRPQRFGNL